jgi:hypothetical protein
MLSRLGIKFEREKIILNGDRWVLLDFFIASVNLAIELDGSQHRDQKQYDHGQAGPATRVFDRTLQLDLIFDDLPIDFVSVWDLHTKFGKSHLPRAPSVELTIGWAVRLGRQTNRRNHQSSSRPSRALPLITNGYWLPVTQCRRTRAVTALKPGM